MLDEKARGDANPILLIDEDDVMAGHAASVVPRRSVPIILLDEPWYSKTRSRTFSHPWILSTCSK